MSVDFDKGNYKDAPEQCFLCNKDLIYSEGVILWFSSEKFIGFHKNCAAEFMAHLGSDLVKLKFERREREKLTIF